MRQPASQLSRVIGYDFNNSGIIEVALTHRSAGSLNNERSEFLGDAILGFIIADELYKQFPDADEGQLSRLRAGLVKRDSLAGIARRIELGKYLNLGPGELRSGGQSRSSILADALEALFAAVYLDGGYPAARHLILEMFQEKLASLNTASQEKDPKTQLQEFLQSKKLDLPVYTVNSITGEQHEQLFTVECHVPELGRKTVGTGKSRRKAEQESARLFLESCR